MKATIYTEDGKVCRRDVECDDIQPYGGCFNILRGSNIITNHPVVVSGQREDWHWKLNREDNIFDLTLTIGDTIKEWKGARCLIFQGSVISFWCDGEWHKVVGKVLVENMREEKNNDETI